RVVFAVWPAGGGAAGRPAVVARGPVRPAAGWPARVVFAVWPAGGGAAGRPAVVARGPVRPAAGWPAGVVFAVWPAGGGAAGRPAVVARGPVWAAVIGRAVVGRPVRIAPARSVIWPACVLGAHMGSCPFIRSQFCRLPEISSPAAPAAAGQGHRSGDGPA